MYIHHFFLYRTSLFASAVCNCGRGFVITTPVKRDGQIMGLGKKKKKCATIWDLGGV